MKTNLKATFAVVFTAAIAIAATLSMAAGPGAGQLTGGGGLTRVVTSNSASQLLSGSGTSANPLLASVTLGANLSGTGSAGSPLTTSGVVLTSRTLTAGTGLSGGGDLSANRTFAMADMAATSIKGNNTGGVAAPIDLTPAQVAAMISNFVASDRVGQFGDGSDGSATMDGAATVACATRSGSVYTANRECFYTDLTINNGVTWIPDGYQHAIKGTLTNNGLISANGGNASGITPGAAATTTNRPLPNGQAGVVNATVGLASGVAPRGFDATAANGGAGGTIGGTPAANGQNGGVGHGGGGGGSGGVTGSFGGSAGSASGSVTLSLSTAGDVRVMHAALSGRLATAFTTYTLGSTGGGGANAVANGGASGASGGWMVLKFYSYAGSGTIESKGGNGAAGAAGVGTAGGGGGGGGSPGGVVVLVTAATSPPTPNVSGGSGGAGGAGAGAGGQAGGNGGAGGAGLSIIFN